MNPSTNILIAGSDLLVSGKLSAALTQAGFFVIFVNTADEALLKIVENRPALVLISNDLPVRAGKSLCALLRNNNSTRQIPLVVYSTGPLEKNQKLEAFRSGADDVLSAPFEMEEAALRVEAILRRAAHGVQDHGPEETFAKPLKTSSDPQPALALPPEHRHFPELMKRVYQIAADPRAVFKNIDDRDFLLSLALVFSTPLVASFAKLFSRSANFEAWIGNFSLGLVANAFMWMGTGGLLNLILPFYGKDVTFRQTLTLAGMGWVARLAGAALTALYSLITMVGSLPDPSDFSAGVDLIPGLSGSAFASFLGNIGLFDVWCAAITLAGVWTLCRMEKNRWNMVTILTGLVCLGIGAFTSY